MGPKARVSMFVCGAIGGIVPTLATLATTYVTVPETPMPTSGLYFGVMLWAVVGGIVALGNHTPEVRNAIFAGIAAPAIVTNVISGASEAQINRADFVGVGLISSAYAQEGDEDSEKHLLSGLDGPGYVIITPHISGVLSGDMAIPVTAQIRVDEQEEEVFLGRIRSTRAMSSFVVPPGAYSIEIGGKFVDVDERITTINVDIEAEPSRISDFWWAMGAPRSYDIQTIDVTKGK